VIMAYVVDVMPSVRRDLKRLPRTIQAKIIKSMFALENDPRPHGVVKLSGEKNLWRVRIADYQILYEIHDDRLTVLVLRVAHRGDAYR